MQTFFYFNDIYRNISAIYCSNVEECSLKIDIVYRLSINTNQMKYRYNTNQYKKVIYLGCFAR